MRWMTRRGMCRRRAPGTGPHRMHLGSARAASVSTGTQGLTLLHFSAQPKPFLAQNSPYTHPSTA